MHVVQRTLIGEHNISMTTIEFWSRMKYRGSTCSGSFLSRKIHFFPPWLIVCQDSILSTRHSGYSFVLTLYSWSSDLCLGIENIKAVFTQMNDNLNEKGIQNALS